MKALHSNKIRDEKDAFVDELFTRLPSAARLLKSGALSAKAGRLHERFLPIHILSHYKPDRIRLDTNYFDMVVSHSIECECLFILGFYNAGMVLLRAGLEAAIKLVYYENHPIEWRLHQAGAHNLHGNQYREFLYSVPDLGDLPFVAKDILETLWTELCKFVHCDLHTVSQLSVVGDLKSVLEFEEARFAELLHRLREAGKVIVGCCFSVDPKWLVGVEKAYFDAVLDVYTAAERQAAKDRLRIS